MKTIIKEKARKAWNLINWQKVGAIVGIIAVIIGLLKVYAWVTVQFSRIIYLMRKVEKLERCLYSLHVDYLTGRISCSPYGILREQKDTR